MSYLFDGTNDSMAGTFASTYNGYPCTLAGWVKVTVHPIAQDGILAFGNSSSTVNSSHAIGTGTTDDTWQARSTDTAPASSNATTAAFNYDGVWVAIVGVYTSTTLRDIYIGSIGNTDQNVASRVLADLMQFIKVGEWLSGAQDFTGRLAELAIWNSALSGANITSYMGGTAASGIAAANLIGYWPLSASNATQSNLGVDTGGDLTVTNAVFDSDHPTISSGSTTINPNVAGMSV